MFTEIVDDKGLSLPALNVTLFSLMANRISYPASLHEGDISIFNKTDEKTLFCDKLNVCFADLNDEFILWSVRTCDW